MYVGYLVYCVCKMDLKAVGIGVGLREKGDSTPPSHVPTLSVTFSKNTASPAFKRVDASGSNC